MAGYLAFLCYWCGGTLMIKGIKGKVDDTATGSVKRVPISQCWLLSCIIHLVRVGIRMICYLIIQDSLLQSIATFDNNVGEYVQYMRREEGV